MSTSLSAEDVLSLEYRDERLAAASSSSPPTFTKPSNQVIDRLLKRLYNAMRDDYQVRPDRPLVSTLNRLFFLSASPRSSLAKNEGSDSGSGGGEDHYDDWTYPSPGGSRYEPNRVFSKATARAIFEDLVCLGTPLS